MNIVHYCVGFISRNRLALWGFLLLMSVLLIVVKDWDWYHNGAFLSQWLCLRLLAQYFPYYILGILCMAYKDIFQKILANEYIIGGLIVMFVVLYIYPGGGFYKALLSGLVGTIIIYQLCRHYQDVLSQSTVVGRQLQLIGRSTLSIYLIHYFFIQGIKMPWIIEHVNISEQGWIITFITIIVAIMVSYASLAVATLLKVSTPLYRIMLGK